MSKGRHVFRRSSLFQFKHGAHICLFYRSADVLLEILTPYIADGLTQGERCFCVQKPEILKRLAHNLTFLGIDTEKEIKRGALEFQTQKEAYLPENHFEPQAMMDMLIASIRQAREQGFSAFRSAGDLSWALEGRNECARVIDYERMVQEYFPGHTAVGLCQYGTREFPSDVLEKAALQHNMNLTHTGPNSVHFSIHVRYERCSAEVVADNFVADPRYHYVVQKNQTREIAGWGVASTFDVAVQKTDRLASTVS